mmetsp:Transcript_16964/g.50752  ORF Transcript_16964/g.50752 Transcript_16964/m.50752 type:complete len:122 (-) Transcript_16964:171-536(-)
MSHSDQFTPFFSTAGCDLYLCFCSFCCPLCQDSFNNASIGRRECTCFDFICWPEPFQHRREIRMKHHLAGSDCVDLFYGLFCYPCTTYYNALELKKRGGVVSLTSSSFSIPARAKSLDMAE